MKKTMIIFCGLFGVFLLCLFSGCGVYDKMDLELASREISILKTTVLDLPNIKEAIENDSEFFTELEDIEFDIFNPEYFDEYLLRREKSDVNAVSLNSYMIIKPSEDKKDLLEEQIDLYYKNLLEEYNQKEDASEEIKAHLQNVMKQEYEGYLIYILSNDNDAVWKKIKERSHPLLFENTKEAKLEDFGLSIKDVSEFKGVTSSEDTSASFYIVVRPKNGKADNIKKSMNQYMKTLDKKWSTYLPNEYKLVKNHMETEVGSYLVYIVSKDNQLVLNTIKDAIVKKD
ncbi:MAG: DUF4358 domain-containing protein [Bacilli bacterium]|jgi:hypothetical protein|nr:DUF4358 domain-containing protein [Bacilli bacterium]